MFSGICFDTVQKGAGDALSLIVFMNEHRVQVSVVSDGSKADDAALPIAGSNEMQGCKQFLPVSRAITA